MGLIHLNVEIVLGLWRGSGVDKLRGHTVNAQLLHIFISQSYGICVLYVIFTYLSMCFYSKVNRPVGGVPR